MTYTIDDFEKDDIIVWTWDDIDYSTGEKENNIHICRVTSKKESKINVTELYSSEEGDEHYFLTNNSLNFDNLTVIGVHKGIVIHPFSKSIKELFPEYFI